MLYVLLFDINDGLIFFSNFGLNSNNMSCTEQEQMITLHNSNEK